MNEIFILFSTITIINEKCLHDKNELMLIAHFHVGLFMRLVSGIIIGVFKVLGLRDKC